MFVKHLPALFARPETAWSRIAAERHSVVGTLAGHVVPLALLAALAWYYGVTVTGWNVPGREEIFRLTPESTIVLIALFFWAMVIGTAMLGYMVYWMSRTYGSEATLGDALALAAYTNTPLYVAGLIGLWPSLWIDLLVGTGVACYAVYLLYVGIPHMMNVPRERGYLFASAALAVALVGFVALLTTTVILWEFGAMPVFTD